MGPLLFGLWAVTLPRILGVALGFIKAEEKEVNACVIALILLLLLFGSYWFTKKGKGTFAFASFVLLACLIAKCLSVLSQMADAFGRWH
jgi:hypothetical protein